MVTATLSLTLENSRSFCGRWEEDREDLVEVGEDVAAAATGGVLMT